MRVHRAAIGCDLSPCLAGELTFGNRCIPLRFEMNRGKDVRRRRRIKPRTGARSAGILAFLATKSCSDHLQEALRS